MKGGEKVMVNCGSGKRLRVKRQLFLASSMAKTVCLCVSWIRACSSRSQDCVQRDKNLGICSLEVRTAAYFVTAGFVAYEESRHFETG